MADTPNTSNGAGELYLDVVTTGPTSPVVTETVTPSLTGAYTNPVSVHQSGEIAVRALGAAHASLAVALGARPDDVTSTLGGTESDNLAIKGTAAARTRKLGLRPVYGFAEVDSEQPANCRPRIIISAIEHPAVAQSATWLHEWLGFEVVYIPVDAQARLDLDTFEREFDGEASERTTMVPTMSANNKVGTVELVEELIRTAHAHGVPIHVNAVQAAGQVPIRSRDWDVDALLVSGHKFGTSKDLGALLVRGHTPIKPMLPGGEQERGLHSGTQSVADAVVFAIGFNESNAHMQAQYRELVMPRDMLIDVVRWVAPRADLTGDPEHRLSGHASFILPGVTGEALLVGLDVHDITTPSDSAHAIRRHEISATLLAMGLKPSIVKSALHMIFRKPLIREQVEHIGLAIEESYTDLIRH